MTHNAENGVLHEYEVWSTYKYEVTGTAHVRARSAAEAVRMALDITAESPVEFIAGEPHSETRMRAARVIPPGSPLVSPAPSAPTTEDGQA